MQPWSNLYVWTHQCWCKLPRSDLLQLDICRLAATSILNLLNPEACSWTLWKSLSLTWRIIEQQTTTDIRNKLLPTCPTMEKFTHADRGKMHGPFGGHHSRRSAYLRRFAKIPKSHQRTLILNWRRCRHLLRAPTNLAKSWPRSSLRPFRAYLWLKVPLQRKNRRSNFKRNRTTFPDGPKLWFQFLDISFCFRDIKVVWNMQIKCLWRHLLTNNKYYKVVNISVAGILGFAWL